MKTVILQGLQIEKEALAERYLGLPTAVGRSSTEAFEYMPARIRGLIGTWGGREASCEGREVLLKSVAQAVPTYSMSCFLLPVDTCKKMRSVIANYWWGSSADNRHIHWQRWDRLIRTKAKGGMGFCDLRMFNLAMLGKQGWRLMTRPHNLRTKVLKGRYFHDGDFPSCSRRKHASYTWRAILAGREVLRKGLVKRVGDGLTTRIWHDRWLPGHFAGQPLMPAEGQAVETVSDLITDSGAWNEGLIRDIFFPVDANAILKLPVMARGEDFWAWEKERHGNYSVKSAYRLQEDVREQQDGDQSEPGVSEARQWKLVWKLEVPPKVKVFWWRVLHDYLPVRKELHRRHIEPTAHCEICGSDEESIGHVLLDCTVARMFWEEAKKITRVKVPCLRLESWAIDLMQDNVCPRKDRALIICGMWSLWMLRNKRRHGEVGMPIRQAVLWVCDNFRSMAADSPTQGAVNKGAA